MIETREIFCKCYVVRKASSDEKHAATSMGPERIFARGGGSTGFSQHFFQGGAKSGEICFLPLEIEKTTFFASNFKIQGGKPPSFRRPWQLDKWTFEKFQDFKKICTRHSAWILNEKIYL